MRVLLSTLFVAATLLVSVVRATDPAWNVVPACASNCTVSVYMSGISTCPATNTTCLCLDAQYQGAVSVCVQATCTVKESLVAKRLGEAQCGVPVAEQMNDIAGLTFVFCLTSLLVGVRLTVKFMGHGGGWGTDDSLILISSAFSIALFGVHLWRIYDLSFGYNTWDVHFSDITSILLAFFANEMLYVIHISITKISVCFFFLRIFDASPVFRRFAYPVIWANVLIMAVFVFIVIFQCKPIHLAWDGWAKEEPGTCLPIMKLVLGNAIINLAMDVAVIGLPIYETAQLQLSNAKKLGVSFMFSMGFALTIIGVVRIVNFWQYHSMDNPTIDLMPLGYWSCIETLVAIMCACLPDCRFFFTRLVPGFVQKSFLSKSYWTLGGSAATSQQRKGTHGSSGKDEESAIRVTTNVTATSSHKAKDSPVTPVSINLTEVKRQRTGDDHDDIYDDNEMRV